jgi:hypothetical protein
MALDVHKDFLITQELVKRTKTFIISQSIQNWATNQHSSIFHTQGEFLNL